MTDLLLVGRVARAHGNKGQVIVNPETDFPEDRFAAGKTLLVGDPPVERRITSVRFHQGRPILGLDGVDTMDAAEALAGTTLQVPAGSLAALPDGTFYRHDLVGCQVVEADGKVIGEVAAVEGPMEASRLVVHGGQGEVLIPLVAEICVEVVPAEKRIRIQAPDGLLELNAPARRE